MTKPNKTAKEELFDLVHDMNENEYGLCEPDIEKIFNWHISQLKRLRKEIEGMGEHPLLFKFEVLDLIKKYEK
jgi:hypothetical protein